MTDNLTENYYVGYIFLENKNGDLFIDERINFLKKDTVYLNPNQYGLFTNWTNGVHYDVFLTLFEKDQNLYKCLHDGVCYTFDGVNQFCVIHDKLSHYLPKIDYELPKVMSNTDAKIIFRHLFKNDLIVKKNIFNNSKKHNKNNFFVSNFSFLKPNCEFSDIKFELKKPEHYLLDKHANFVSAFKIEEGTVYNYICVGMKTKEGFINLCNNQLYVCDNFDPGHFFKWFKTLDEYIKLNGGKLKDNEITINYSLQLIKQKY